MELSFTIIIIGITVVLSLLAFNNAGLMEKLVFYPYRMWRNNEWYRLITYGFVHADIPHLFFNMFSLYSFGRIVEVMFKYIFPGRGGFTYLAIYLVAIVVSNLYELFKRRDDYGYTGVGASGGVAAVIFASILLDPFNMIYMPIPIPGALFGALYLFYCVYMAKRGRDNIGHTAHFSGAVFGFFMPVLLEPQLLVRFIQLLKNGI